MWRLPKADQVRTGVWTWRLPILSIVPLYRVEPLVFWCFGYRKRPVAWNWLMEVYQTWPVSVKQNHEIIKFVKVVWLKHLLREAFTLLRNIVTEMLKMMCLNSISFYYVQIFLQKIFSSCQNSVVLLYQLSVVRLSID